jgi:hypothetical protein
MKNLTRLILIGFITQAAPPPRSEAQLPPAALQDAVSDPEAVVARFEGMITDKQAYQDALGQAARGVANTPNLGLPGVPPVGPDSARQLLGEGMRSLGELAADSAFDQIFGNTPAAIYQGYNNIYRGAEAISQAGMTANTVAEAEAWRARPSGDPVLGERLRQVFSRPDPANCATPPRLACQLIAQDRDRTTNECIVLSGRQTQDGNWEILHFATVDCVFSAGQGYRLEHIVAVDASQQRSFRVVGGAQFRTFAGGSQYASFCYSCDLLQGNASGKNVKGALDKLGRDLYCAINPNALTCVGRK